MNIEIYKVYYEVRSECKKNDASAFQEEVMNLNDCTAKVSYFTDREDAKKCYDSIELLYDKAEKAGHSLWFFSGKLLEVGYIDSDDYNDLNEDGESLEYIFNQCERTDIEMVDVSKEEKLYEEEDE